MSEIEKLKAICEKIGYTNEFFDMTQEDYLHKQDELYSGYTRRADVREIIFTLEFIDKLYEYNSNYFELFKYQIFEELNNPIDYLYNLLFN